MRGITVLAAVVWLSCVTKRPRNLQLLSHDPHLLFAAPALRQTPVSCAFQALHMYAPRAFLYLCTPALSLCFLSSSRGVWLKHIGLTHHLWEEVFSTFPQTALILQVGRGKMNNLSHAACPMEKIWEQNPPFFFLRFFLYSLGITMSSNAGIILKISQNCGAEKRSERLFEIYFFCLIHMLLPNYFWVATDSFF